MVYISGAIAALISAIIGAFAGGMIGYLSKRRKWEKAEDDLLLCISRAALFAHYQEVISRGHSVAQEIGDPGRRQRLGLLHRKLRFSNQCGVHTMQGVEMA